MMAMADKGAAARERRMTVTMMKPVIRGLPREWFALGYNIADHSSQLQR